MAPCGPVPVTVARSMPSSWASCRAEGELAMRWPAAGSGSDSAATGAAAGGFCSAPVPVGTAVAPSPAPAVPLSMVASSVPTGTVWPG